ncbi:hypothetical protein ACFDTO_21650 [Microbacteriaceae bacterium 4G12]
MKKDITIFIEYLAFLGLICCLFIININLSLLLVLIAFVSCEILIEAFHIKLKSHISHFYNAIFLISILTITIMANGLQLTSFCPTFFVAILLIISKYAYIPELNKKGYGVDSLQKKEAFRG